MIKTKVQLEAENDTNITTNGNGDITGAVLNAFFTNLIDSLEIVIQSYTTVEIAAIASPTLRQIVFDTTTNEYKYYNGSAWVVLSSLFIAGSGTNSIMDKRATASSATNGTAIGDDATNAGSGSQAIGKNAETTSSGSSGQAIGYGAYNSGEGGQALGFNSVNRITKSTNIGGAIIIRKDNSETDPYRYFAGTEDVILTSEIDLKATSTTTITLPSNVKFFVNEVGTIMTQANTISVQPTVSFGKTGSNAFLLAATATTGLTAAGKRDKQTSILQAEGVTSLVAEITIAATATTANGRFYFKGFIVEDE